MSGRRLMLLGPGSLALLLAGTTPTASVHATRAEPGATPMAAGAEFPFGRHEGWPAETGEPTGLAGRAHR
jgi:hypothetical protein